MKTTTHGANPETEKIRVTLVNLEHVYADFIGWDHWTDSAVLRINEKEIKKHNFSYVQFGSSDNLFLAQEVFSVGIPYGLTRTLTKGIISNTNRYIEARLTIHGGYEIGGYNNWVQTNAAINLRNTGGPLVRKAKSSILMSQFLWQQIIYGLPFPSR